MVNPARLNTDGDDLAFLLALVAIGDQNALIRVFDQTYLQVDRWLAAGISAEPRRNKLLVTAFVEVWARANQFRPESMSPLQWLASITLDVVHTAVEQPPTTEAA